MATPRYIVPGTTYLVTRRTSERRFLLRPDPKVAQAFEFCLAYAAERSGIIVHAYVVLSNHYHLVVTDPDGHLPEFQHWLDTYVAKVVNTLRGRWEALWAPGSYSAVRLEGAEDVHNKLLYTFLNPLKSLLVSSVRDWPGPRSLPECFGTRRVVKRPRAFFRADGRIPKTASLQLQAPAGVDLEQLTQDLKDAERDIRQRAKRRKQAFLGVRAIMRQRPNASPDSPTPKRTLSPKIASLDPLKRREAIERLRSFLRSYRDALHRYTSGERTVEFPRGTYLMRIQFNVACASEP